MKLIGDIIRETYVPGNTLEFFSFFVDSNQLPPFCFLFLIGQHKHWTILKCCLYNSIHIKPALSRYLLLK